MSPQHLVFVALNQFDPHLRDGACCSMVDRLRFLQAHDHRVSILSCLCHDYTERLLGDALADPGTPVIRDTISCRTVFHGLNFVEYRLPIPLHERLERAASVRQHLLAAIAKESPDQILTADEAYEPLFAAWWLKIPGAHFFNAPLNVDRFARNLVYHPFLKTRTVFANSGFTQACIRERLRLEAIVWYPPVASGAIVRPAVPGHTYTIGYSSSQGWVKGDAVVAELSRRLPQYPLIVVGARYSQAGPTPPNVSYWGHIPDMDRFYRQIDALVVPSLWEEAFSRVIVEAAAYGVPVVANRVGGIPEALGDGGVLIDCVLDPAPDPGELADRYAAEIRRLFEDEALYAGYCRRALAQAESFRQAQTLQAEAIYRRHFSASRARNGPLGQVML